MNHEPGFDEEKWQAYVDAGGCPSVDVKTWCNGRAGHEARLHFAFHRDSRGIIDNAHYWSHP